MDTRGTDKIQFRHFQSFLEKNYIFWFPCCSTREDLFIDASSTNVGLILTKLGRFLFSGYGHSGYGRNSISSISKFLKKIHIFWFPCCSTRKDISIDVSFTNVIPILTKPGWFLFSGVQTDRQTDGQTDRQTDTVLESSCRNMSVRKQFQLKAQN